MNLTLSFEEKLIGNLYATIGLTEVCYQLKAAYYRSLWPDAGEAEIEKRIAAEAIERRERAWNCQSG